MGPNKPRNPVLDYAVYVAVRAVVCFLQAVPLRVALGFGNVLALLAYHFDKRHREVARDNLRHAFPERCADPAECDRLVRACYRHFFTMVVEIACLPRRIHLHNWRSFGEDVRHFERIMVALLGDRPVLLVTAHYGNWEVAGYVTGLVGLRTYAIAREIDNPHLDRFLRKFRQKTGQTILSKADFGGITAALAAGGAVATLGDQDAGPKGMFVDFFNRPASTHKAVALLALEHDALMVVLGIPRIANPMKFVLEAEDLIDPREYSGRPGAAREITVRFTQAIERMVRRHPEQYFWLHRRWKHQPPPPKGKAATTPVLDTPPAPGDNGAVGSHPRRILT